MPKIKNYELRLPEGITGNEYLVVSDSIENKTYRVNLQDVIEALAPVGGGENAPELTADELAAVQGANAPSASNVFATMDDVGTTTGVTASVVLNAPGAVQTLTVVNGVITGIA